jgi:4-diphosphocytidyl-2C-methyl-D-erythritol kinase
MRNDNHDLSSLNNRITLADRVMFEATTELNDLNVSENDLGNNEDSIMKLANLNLKKFEELLSDRINDEDKSISRSPCNKPIEH